VKKVSIILKDRVKSYLQL